MVARVFRIRPKRLYWQVYIEAWQTSGMSKTAFCKEHGLCARTFFRWHKMFEEDAGYKLEQLKKKRKKRPKPSCLRYRGKALQAFWAMHIEALWWSGLSVPAYAKAHRLSRYTLAKWRKKLMEEPEGINWRDLVHPSARPEVNPGSFSPVTKPVTKELPSQIEPPKDGRSRRRHFTLTQKRAIVMETRLPNITVSDVARRYDIATSVLFRWRNQFDLAKQEATKLACVQVVDDKLGRKAGDQLLQKLLPSQTGMIAVDLNDGRQVFAPQGSDPEDVKAYVARQEKRS